MEASVSEIHSYPLRPEGFEESLFPSRESRLAVLDHLLGAPWLSRASEMEERGGQTAHARYEPVELENRHGCLRIVWASGRGRCHKRRHVVEVLGNLYLVPQHELYAACFTNHEGDAARAPNQGPKHAIGGADPPLWIGQQWKGDLLTAR